MKNNKQSSMDGFIPRRPGSQLGAHNTPVHARGKAQPTPKRPELKSEEDIIRAGTQLGRASAGRHLDRSDIDESLREIDDTSLDTGKKLSRRERKRIKRENRTKNQRIRSRIIKIVVVIIIAGVLAAGGWLAYKALQATDGVLNGSFMDLIQNEPLKEDANGRSNFLIVGTSEDDPGHEGGDLTDSIMVVSVNQKNKDAYMFSIPRDLYVDYGMGCNSGYRGKINEYFGCVNTGEDDAAKQDRLQKTQKFIGDIVGLDIQYGVQVNYTVMRDTVNAIGGELTVTIDSRDPRGVMDSNFDWKCGKRADRIKNCPPSGHFIDLPNGEVTLNAEQALYLAQARGAAAPTYGLEQSNFDRERNQQKIIVAMRDKAMSAGTLTNIGAVTGLIDALGNNLRTNVATKEVRTLMDLAQKISTDNIQSIDLNSEDDPIFTNGNIGGASIVQPAAGLYSYSKLRAFIAKQLSSDPFVKEEPQVVVLNGSSTAGVAQTAADKLLARGFAIDAVDNAPEGTYETVEIYQVTAEKTATAAKLKEIYGVTVKTTPPPVAVATTTDFVIIIGNATAVQ